MCCRWACVTVAVLEHYFSLAAACWTTALAVDFCRARLRQAKAKVGVGGNFATYSLVAWLIPAVIVGAALSLDTAPLPVDTRHYAPLYGYTGCWASGVRAIIYFVACPLLILFIINAILYTIAARITYCPTSRRLSHHTASVRSVGSIMLAGSSGGGTGGGCGDGLGSVTSSRTNERRSDRRRLALYVTTTLYLGAVWTVALSAAWLRYRSRQHDVTPPPTSRDVDGPMERLLTYAFIVLYTILGPFVCLSFISSPAVVREFQRKLLGRQLSSRSSISFHRRAGSDKDRYMFPLPSSPGPVDRFSMERHTGNGRGVPECSYPLPYPGVPRTYLFEGEVVTRETCI